jgi:ERCC4-type nuclease
MNERDALLVLNAIPGIGNSGARKLLKRYGSACGALSFNENGLMADPVISPKAAENILCFPKDKFLETE